MWTPAALKIKCKWIYRKRSFIIYMKYKYIKVKVINFASIVIYFMEHIYLFEIPVCMCTRKKQWEVQIFLFTKIFFHLKFFLHLLSSFQ